MQFGLVCPPVLLLGFGDLISLLQECDSALLLAPAIFIPCHTLRSDRNYRVLADLLDNTNTNFMFRLMPYYFGAGCCFITGAPPVPSAHFGTAWVTCG